VIPNLVVGTLIVIAHSLSAEILMVLTFSSHACTKVWTYQLVVTSRTLEYKEQNTQ